MTVKELIEELKKMPQDAEVYRANTDPNFWLGELGDEQIYKVQEVNNFRIRIK